MQDTSKIVCIGDLLTQDVLFGNINNMATVWINKYRDKCTALS